MNDELRLDADKNEISLEDNKSDRAVVALKGALGAVPVVGSILSEVIGVVIPNQKSDRIKLFVQVYAEKVKYIEKDVLELKMKTEKFTDLFEDALPQAARALSGERREYIATFLKNSLSTADAEHIKEKKLLSLLNELNDVEIIYLMYEALEDYKKKESFYQIHEIALNRFSVTFNSSQSEYDDALIQESYNSTLEKLGLTKPVFRLPKKGELPEYDKNTGKLESSHTNVTGLGRLLLKYIDDDFARQEDELN